MTKVAIKETGIETPMIIDDRMLRKKINTITIEIKAANSIFVVTELMEVRTNAEESMIIESFDISQAAFPLYLQSPRTYHRPLLLCYHQIAS